MDSLVCQKALNRALRQIKRFLDAGKDGFPHITRNGGWQRVPDGTWTGGFGVGLLWLACYLSGESMVFRWRRGGRAIRALSKPHSRCRISVW